MEYVNNSHYLGQKCARIFSQGHFLFQDVNCFPRVKLEENCELWGIDNFQEQMYKHILHQMKVVVVICRSKVQEKMLANS